MAPTPVQPRTFDEHRVGIVRPGWDEMSLARARRRRRPARPGASIALAIAPMIDLTFLLLIFFLVTTTFERAEGLLASKLPRDTGAPGVALPISPIVVRVSRTGPGHDDYAIRIDHFDNAPAHAVELTEMLRRIQNQPGFDAKTPVVIAAKDDVKWDHVVGCWNAAVAAGYEQIAFAEP